MMLCSYNTDAVVPLRNTLNFKMTSMFVCWKKYLITFKAPKSKILSPTQTLYTDKHWHFFQRHCVPNSPNWNIHNSIVQLWNVLACKTFTVPRRWNLQVWWPPDFCCSTTMRLTFMVNRETSHRILNGLQWNVLFPSGWIVINCVIPWLVPTRGQALYNPIFIN